MPTALQSPPLCVVTPGQDRNGHENYPMNLNGQLHNNIMAIRMLSHQGSQWVSQPFSTGCFTLGSFMNYITCSFKEPWLIIVMDLCIDHQAIRKVSYIHIPVILLMDIDILLKFVDVANPMNNKSHHVIGARMQ
ncbi:hypothetical protein F5148DRAFT_1146312 [Russula earlei]|uniref:Uncharacterized protein n=1 Tax=Russula earlei TaxID=71964 RepID=A0ACC0UM25_9AGAM|nr:hypothetical protein F5148DRAFT_1146312 [Russula earlei]